MNRRPKKRRLLSRGDLRALGFAVSHRGLSAHVHCPDPHTNPVLFVAGSLPGCYFSVDIRKTITLKKLRSLALDALIKFRNNNMRIRKSAALSDCYRHPKKYNNSGMLWLLLYEPAWYATITGFRLSWRSGAVFCST
jgi:hypothetical protein